MTWRHWVLNAVVTGSVLATAWSGPFPQDLRYHQFADRRAACGVPNARDVLSNLAFVLVGLAGLLELRRNPSLDDPAYGIFFLGLILIALGSAYYHLAPDNQRLTWDRLAMTIAFMALVAIVVGDHVSARLGRLALPILLAAGMASVLHWRLTERRGHGDLRFYALVQLLPLLLIPLITVLFPSTSLKSHYLLGMVGAYCLAKVFEAFDARIYSAGGFVSGHTLKHVMAAASAYLLVLALRAQDVATPR